MDDTQFTGTIVVQPGQAKDASVRILPLDPKLTVRVPFSDWTGSSLSVPYNYGLDPELFKPQFEGRTFEPMGSPERVRPAVGDFDLMDAVAVFAYGSTVHLTDSSGTREWQTGQFPHDGLEEHNAPTNTTVGSYDRIFLVVMAPRANIELTHGGAWWYSVEKLAANATGDLAFSGVDAQAHVDRHFLDKRLGLLQLRGNFSLASDFSSGHGQWDIVGNATFVAADAVTVVGSRFPAEAVAVASLAFMGVVALLWAFIRHGLPWILSYNRALPLENPTRVKMLRLIAESPGITTSQIRSELGVKRPSIALHGRILARAGYIEVKRLGNRDHFQLNSGTFAFAAPAPEGQSTVSAGRVAQRAANPTRRAILAALNACGGAATFEQVRVQLVREGGSPPSRRLFAYHVGLMEQDGILVQDSIGGQVTWRLNVDAQRLWMEQKSRVLAVGARQQLVALASSAPVPEETMKDWVASEDRLSKALTDLTALGILSFDERGRSYVVSPKWKVDS